MAQRLMPRRISILFLCFTALALGAAACGGDDDERRGAEDFAGEELVLLTHDSFAITQDTITAFEDEFDVTVKIVPTGDAVEAPETAPS